MVNLQKADVIFVADNTLLSWYIRYKEGFPYSHVCIADGEGGIWTTNATRKWSVKPPFYHYLYGRVDAEEFLKDKTHWAICRYDGLTPDEAGRVIEYCESQEGLDYPVWDLVTLIAKGTKGEGVDSIYNKPVEINAATPKICTEGVVEAYKYAGKLLNPRAMNKDSTGYDLREVFDDPKLSTVESK